LIIIENYLNGKLYLVYVRIIGFRMILEFAESIIAPESMRVAAREIK